MQIPDFYRFYILVSFISKIRHTGNFPWFYMGSQKSPKSRLKHTLDYVIFTFKSNKLGGKTFRAQSWLNMLNKHENE